MTNPPTDCSAGQRPAVEALAPDEVALCQELGVTPQLYAAIKAFLTQRAKWEEWDRQLIAQAATLKPGPDDWLP